MRRLESQDPDFKAWVELPEEWTIGHYYDYWRAYDAMKAEDDARIGECKIAGVMALALKGVIVLNIPGLTTDYNFREVDKRAIGLLLDIAGEVQGLDLIPFGSPAPSAIGTTGARADTSPDRPETPATGTPTEPSP